MNPWENQTYLVKKVEQSPFNQDDIGKNVFILCEPKTEKPIAEIGRELPWYIKEGAILNNDEVALRHTSKRSKHLVLGDTVQLNDYHGFIVGELDKIDENEDEDWDDIFHLKNCRLSHPDADKFIGKDKKIEPLQKVKRKDCQHANYLYCEDFKFSEESKWELFEKEWKEFTSPGAFGKKELMRFLKERVELK